MSAENKHIIQKQFLEVEMHDPPDAFAFRNRLGELYYQLILPQLETMFDEVGTPHKLIRREMLSIDLGIISSENWEEVLVDKAVRKIKEALSWESPVYLNEKTKLSNQAEVNAKAHERKEQTVQNKANILFFFLENGFFPWYVPKVYDLKKELAFWIDHDPSSFIISFRDFLIGADQKTLHRLIYQFEDELLRKILSLLAKGKWWQEVIEFENSVRAYLTNYSLSPSMGRRIFYYPLLQTALANDGNSASHYWSFLIREIHIETGNSFENIASELQVALQALKTKNADGLPSLIKQLQQTATSPVKKVVVEKGESKKEPADIDGIYIQNAGLVILHPFLSAFFNHIGLTDDENNFKDEASHQKAVLISQYLVTGEIEIAEEALALNKLLCGYPFDDPITRELQLSDDEKAETRDLLNQVMQAWKMNGVPVNTSIEGLQQSFLQRSGKLVQKENDWMLQVEQRPFDIVLASLPWGIGIIKNKWMRGMLWVEWT